MRSLIELEPYRVKGPGYDPHPDHLGLEGMFLIPFRTGTLRVIASNDAGWDHVSVSLPNRCPTWPEMCHVKERFFLPTETVMQLHVPDADWISNHPYCLHLWRPWHEPIPRPPGIFVGIQELGDLSKVMT